MMENETCLRIKKFISNNNGREYENFEFKKFCYENRIKLEKTAGTPQHDGMVEWMNIILTKTAMSMHLYASLLKQF